METFSELATELESLQFEHDALDKEAERLRWKYQELEEEIAGIDDEIRQLDNRIATMAKKLLAAKLLTSPDSNDPAQLSWIDE